MATPVQLERRPDQLTAAPPVVAPPLQQQPSALSQLRPVRESVREGLTNQQNVAKQAIGTAATVLDGAIQRGNNLALNDQWNKSQLRNLLIEGSA